MTRNKCTPCFPGDPRFSTRVDPLKEDVEKLGNKEMLSTRLLDCLLQRAGPPQESGSGRELFHVCGLTGTEYMTMANDWIDELSGRPVAAQRTWLQRNIKKLRTRLADAFQIQNESKNRLLVPIVESSHFFVLVLDFDPSHPEFFVDLSFYDSLRRSTRGSRGVPAYASSIVETVNDFFNNFVLYKRELTALQQSNAELLRKVSYHECPQQLNGIDCGLFCVGVVLHLLDGTDVDGNTFSHQDCSRLRVRLSRHFLPTTGQNMQKGVVSQTTCQVVRDSFPLLLGSSVASLYGVEDVTRAHLADMSTTETTITTTKSTTKALAAGVDHHDSDADDVVVLENRNRERRREKEEAKRRQEIRRVRAEFGSKSKSKHAPSKSTHRFQSKSLQKAANAAAAALIPGKPRKPKVLSDVESYDMESYDSDEEEQSDGVTDESDEEELSDGVTDDDVLQYLLRREGVETFPMLEDIDPIIREYEKRSGNKLKIKKSSPNCFRLYGCTEHPSCTYQIFVGKRRDGCFSVKRIFAQHDGHRGTMRSSVASMQGTKRNDAVDDEDMVDNYHDGKEKGGKEEDDDSDASYKDANSSEKESEEEVEDDNGDDTGTVDNLFDDLLKESNVFASLEDIDPLVALYEKKSGNHLCIARSLKNSYRQYVCKEHVNCTFQVFVGRRRGDGMFSVKRLDRKHSGERRDARAKDGRMWKERRSGKLDNMIVQVIRTKKEKPTPADVVKTAATELGQVIPYMTAYRALHSESKEQKYMQRKNFELIIPYLDSLKKANPGSVIGYSRDEDKCMNSIHVFPGFMNESLSYVRPVVSLDAAHLKGVHKGTLYVASVLSGKNDVYPIGFLISKGNEDGNTWTTMLTLLKEACPILSSQGFVPTGVAGVEHPRAYLDYRHAFIFVSDRDKGLKPALQAVFPRNYAVSCAKHIQANVSQRFGQQAARPVITMAKSFSTRYVDYLLGQVRAIKPAAADYIESIDDLWRSTDWMSYERQIPPRYGIVTSNTSECVNNMFAEARTLGWLECLDKLVDIMSNRIFQCRTKHMDKVSLGIVPKVAERLQARWEAAASLTVMELQAGCGDFKVVEISSVREQDYEGDDRIGVIPLSPGSQVINIVKPGRQWCSCGLWQEFLYPCRHGCAVYRKWEEKDLNYVLENVVHVFYRYDYVQKLFQNNVFPTCIDNATYDGETKPPRVTGRQAGRPRTKRIRRRSEFLDPEKSPITCSECGKKGHNKRTCKG